MTLIRAMATDGWMEDATLLWLNEQGRIYKRVVEVGSWKGKSTLALAEHVNFLLAVDHWDGPPDIYVSPEERGNSYVNFVTNLDDYIKAKKVLPLKVNCRDLTVEQLPKPAIFDMVFIDSDHSYEAVLSDIKFWKPLIRKGGLLCGHDYDWAASAPTVRRGVFEGLPGLVVQHPVWNVWAVNV